MVVIQTRAATRKKEHRKDLCNTLDYAGIIIEAYVAYISIPVQDIAVGIFYLAYLLFCVGQLLLCSFQL